MYKRQDLNLAIIPVINKIDLPSANLPKVYRQLEDIVCIPHEAVSYTHLDVYKRQILAHAI